MSKYILQSGLEVAFTTLESKPQIKVCSLSPHTFKLSDGTVVPEQTEGVVKQFTLKKIRTFVRDVHGMNVFKSKFLLTDDQQEFLKQITSAIDVVIAPYILISALWDTGVRDQFVNVLAYNSTPETERSSPSEKIVDINNWSY